MDTRGSSQTRGPAGKKRYKGASLDNSETASPSGREIVECPQDYTTINDNLLVKDTKMCVGRFFYERGLDFSAVNSSNFQRMVFLFSRGMRYQTPTVEELKGWIFKEVMKEMHEHVNDIRKSWADTGCSILLDGWTDANGRELVNVLVDCPKGTLYLGSSDITVCVESMDSMQFFVKVLAEIGIENVVQIITYSNSAFMKETGKQLMEKYRPIFWTVSASYCIELMLEKLGGMDLIKETLEKAKFITRFIHSHPVALKYVRDHTDGSDLVDSSKIRSIRPFLTLENIFMVKETLKEMFLSSHPDSTSLTSDMAGQRVAELVADRSFWSGASTIVKGAIPLVRVIEWMNTNGKDHIGFIYETIDQAKETIKEEFKNKKSQYSPFWKAIDDVWNEFLYSPLHSAGYYLNPNIFYSSEVYIDPEVVTGLYCCIVRSAADLRIQDRITVQMEQYRTARGAMAAGVAEDKRSNISPALWWSRYGGECPELQRLAIRILSQTCDGALKFQLKRSLAETLLIKGRSRTDQKLQNDLVFLRYNMQLRNFVPGKTNYAMCDELDPLDDWIVDNAQTNVPRNNVVNLDGPSGYVRVESVC